MSNRRTSKQASRRVAASANQAEENEEEESEVTMQTADLSTDSVDEDDEEAEALAAADDEDDDVETDDEDEESDDDDSDEEASADAGSKPEKIDRRKLKKGPRQAQYFCSAYVENISFDDPENEMKTGDSGVIQVSIAVTMPSKAKEFFDTKKARQEAIEIFTKKYGVAPARISRPAYFYLGEKKKPSTPRDSIKVENLAGFTGQLGSAVHYVRGVPWNVKVQFTQREDEVFVLYKEPAVKLDKKMQRPQPRGLKISALSDVKRAS